MINQKYSFSETLSHGTSSLYWRYLYPDDKPGIFIRYHDEMLVSFNALQTPFLDSRSKEPMERQLL